MRANYQLNQLLKRSCIQFPFDAFWTIFRIFVSGSKFEPYSCGCCYFQILVSLAGQIWDLPNARQIFGKPHRNPEVSLES